MSTTEQRDTEQTTHRQDVHFWGLGTFALCFVVNAAGVVLATEAGADLLGALAAGALGTCFMYALRRLDHPSRLR